MDEYLEWGLVGWLDELLVGWNGWLYVWDEWMGWKNGWMNTGDRLMFGQTNGWNECMVE